MSIPKTCGHDRRGKEISDDDIIKVPIEYKKWKKMESRNISFNVSANQLSINSRFNPKFFNFQKIQKKFLKVKILTK